LADGVIREQVSYPGATQLADGWKRRAHRRSGRPPGRWGASGQPAWVCFLTLMVDVPGK